MAEKPDDLNLPAAVVKRLVKESVSKIDYVLLLFIK